MRFFSNLFNAIRFCLSIRFTKLKGFRKPKSRQERKVKSTKIAYRAYESYRLGECIVTLAKFGPEGKLEVAEKLKAYEATRINKERELSEEGERIMLMSPEELKRYQIEEWLKQRRGLSEKQIYDSLSNEYQTNNKKDEDQYA